MIGGPGTDDLSGEGGSTMTDGTGGADTILARDGEADTISCGTRADRAVVDQFDLWPSPGGADTCEAVESENVGGPRAEPRSRRRRSRVGAPPPTRRTRPAALTVGTKSARLKAERSA